MTVSNRLQVAVVRETTPGTTPTTPRMRKKRITGEALRFTPSYEQSDEIRDDRMTGDPIPQIRDAGGTINDELSYPDDESPDSEFYRSLFYSVWSNTPQRFNDGTADSVITGVATTNEEVTHTTAAAFVASQLVRFTGFGVAGNNGVFKCTTGGATTSRYIGAGLTNESAPPAAARMKTVGFAGASGDITALADGIGSTSLDFTTLGLLVGQWVKIGGTANGDTFAFLVTAGSTARSKAWARITAIAATKLTLDNLPSGWTTDDGTGKTIKVWFGDRIKNGTTKTALTIEKGFLGQQTPTYIATRGMVAGQCQHSMSRRGKVTRVWTFMGMGGAQGTSALDASPDAQTTGRAMAAHSNVGRIAEAGATLSDPNWASSLEFTINNNLRSVEAVDETSPVGVNEGECTVTGRLESYFGSNALLAKFFNGTASAINSRVQQDGQALVYQFPRVTFDEDGNPAASGKNQDVMLPLGFRASYDSLTGAHVLLDRLEYYES